MAAEEHEHSPAQFALPNRHNVNFGLALSSTVCFASGQANIDPAKDHFALVV
jgi:hypothetical protein